MKRRDNKYRNYVLKTVSDNEKITFLSMTQIGTGKEKSILAVSMETYGLAEGETLDSLRLVIRDGKRRRKQTLEKAGITEQEFLNGMEASMAAKEISNYLIKNGGLMAGINIAKEMKTLNEFLNLHEMKQDWDAKMIELKVTAADCEKVIEKEEEKKIEKMRELFSYCMQKYQASEEKEENRKDCIVYRAYFWVNDKQPSMKRIICYTSIGVFYYDVIKQRWGITQEHKKEYGFGIESVDIDSIMEQLAEKYGVGTMRELAEKLKEKQAA